METQPQTKTDVRTSLFRYRYTYWQHGQDAGKILYNPNQLEMADTHKDHEKYLGQESA
jgi:hypothetical protein